MKVGGGLSKGIWGHIYSSVFTPWQVRALYSMYTIVGASVSKPHSMVQVMCAWYKRKTSPVQVAGNACNC